jgi:hypothetical protein
MHDLPPRSEETPKLGGILAAILDALELLNLHHFSDEFFKTCMTSGLFSQGYVFLLPFYIFLIYFAAIMAQPLMLFSRKLMRRGTTILHHWWFACSMK